MFESGDIIQIEVRGSRTAVVNQQLENFKHGFPLLQLIEAANVYHGIIKLSENEITHYISVFDKKISEGLDVVKFVPASGAATRMFKSLYTALDEFKSGKTVEEVKSVNEIAHFFEKLDEFAFFNDLKALATSESKIIEQIPESRILEWLLLEQGLNYGNLPKALLKFHHYENGSRTSLEEHFVEAALYSLNNRNVAKLHFTVSVEHQKAVEKLVNQIIPQYENLFGITYDVSFSNQKPSTDTVAVTIDNELFRDRDGHLLFRPAGHGALIENLNDLDSDLIFIKNIDNVVPDRLKAITVEYKKALAGILITLQKQLFDYQKIINTHKASELESGFYAELANFVENVLNVSPLPNLLGSSKDELFNYLSSKINRPLRVCGMVRNTGEPGGGPFFAMNSDGSVSLQIAESSQIDFSIPEQAQIARQATHFNPVDLVCGVKNYERKKYNLTEFIDPETGLITQKSYDGKELKAQELPGLWNGSMSDWNTLFVEVPIETFSPVKTVNDLLRKEHQTK